MGGRIDLTGQRFGRLVVEGYAYTDKHGQAIWCCVCDCGNKKNIRSVCLRNGESKSCGCLSRELASKRDTVRNTKHGASRSRLYRIWGGMQERCNNQKRKVYAHYGGRGICVCEEWKDFAVFQKWAIENGYRDDLTIDRINNNGDYEPSNCRWVDMKQQGRNRRSNHLITYMGQTKTATEWAEQFQIDRRTLYRRLKAGWSVEKALETPVENPEK